MRADEFARLLTSLGSAADVVEAIDRPALQTERGWDLSGWSYELIPWGVRFRPPGSGSQPGLAVTALAEPGGAPSSQRSVLVSR